MKNITVAIPTETWRIARIWCAQTDTSLSEIVSGILDRLPRIHERWVKEAKKAHRQALAREANGRFARRTPAATPPSPHRDPAALSPATGTPSALQPNDLSGSEAQIHPPPKPENPL